MPTHHRVSSRRLGALPARYAFVLNPYSGERFTNGQKWNRPLVGFGNDVDDAPGTKISGSHGGLAVPNHAPVIPRPSLR